MTGKEKTMHPAKPVFWTAQIFIIGAGLYSAPAIAQTSSQVCNSVEIREAMQSVENQYTRDPNGAALSALGAILTGVNLDSTATVIDSQEGSDGGRYTSKAMNNIAAFYQKGTVVELDYARAMEWYGKASEGGLAQAMTNLGAFYEAGLGVRRSPQQAACWYGKGAGGGDAWGMTYLGFLYNKGEGVPVNHAEAMKLYLRAVELGQPLAMNNIGAMYENGWGVEKNLSAAVQWYRKAAAAGDSTAAENLSRLGIR